MRVIIFSILMVLLFPLFSEAQYFRSSNYWRQYRNEIAFGMGVTNFLGELGGRDQIGTDFIYDLELKATKGALGFGYRYFTSRKTAAFASFYMGYLNGDDQLTKEPYRQNRNLHFRSPIFELAIRYEYHLVNERVGHRYNLKGAKGMRGGIIGAYIFAGAGLIYFNPQAKLNRSGGWIKLHPLGTEGQGLDGGAEPYKRLNYALPVGIGLRQSINLKWRLSLEVGYRKTFTDYLDDVSTNYYDNDILRAERGDNAAELADPSLGNFVLDPTIGLTNTNHGMQRGDSTDKDAYFFAMLSVNYKLTKKSKSFKRIKSRRAMPSF